MTILTQRTWASQGRDPEITSSSGFPVSSMALGVLLRACNE